MDVRSRNAPFPPDHWRMHVKRTACGCGFLLASLMAAGCSSLEKPPSVAASPAATPQAADARVERLVRDTIGIDAHNHVDVPLVAAELPGPAVDLAGELDRSGLSAIGMTFAVDYQPLTHDGEAFDRFLTGMQAMDGILLANHASRALDAEDLRSAHQQHRPIVIQAVEGCHFLEGRIERLKVAYDHGLRHLGLLHDSDASVPLGDVYTNPPRWGGLTAFGAAVVRECERLGILIDLAHGDDRTVDMVLRIATRPVIISHTGLDTQLGGNPKFAQMMRPRLISAATARKVAAAGGVICVWTHLAETPMEYAQNIRALVAVAGIDHVALGTDTKLTLPYRPPTDPRGQGGFRGDHVGERTGRAWKDQQVGFYHAVVAALLQTGFSDEEIAKIGGGNYLRVFAAATGR